MYFDSISDWEIPQAMQGDQKNKQKLCDLESVHPFAELKRSTVLSRGLYLQVSQEVVFQLLWWSVTDSLFSLWIKMEFQSLSLCHTFPENVGRYLQKLNFSSLPVFLLDLIQSLNRLPGDFSELEQNLLSARLLLFF